MGIKLLKFLEFIRFFNFKNKMDQRNISILLLTAYCIVLSALGGCASSLQRESILAVVDGEPITERDLEYSLNIAHRREDLSSGGVLDLSEYIQKLVDDQLIIDEARNTGMDKYPEVQKAVQAYILREAVLKLYNDEITDKVSITEKEIENYYKKNFEQFLLEIIEVSSEEEANEILEKLKEGSNFEEIAKKYSSHRYKQEGSKIVLRRNSLSTYMAEAISKLKPGELSDVIKTMNKYYIIKLIGRKEAPDEELNSVRSRIEQDIRKQKEKERSDEYLKYLREKANIKIDKEILSSIKLGEAGEDLEKWKKDERPLVDVDGSILTVALFVELASPYSRKSNEDIINGWIDRKLVDNEALSYHYEETPDLKKKIYRYENQIIKRTFIKRIIIPQIIITDEKLEEYYLTHQKNFVNPARFRIQQITVKTMDEAQDVLDSLKNGADFSWLSKRKSKDSAASKGGDAGWVTKAGLPQHVREIIDILKIGEISPVIKIDSFYRIVKLQDKTGETVKSFDEVKNDVYGEYFNEQVKSILNKYVDQLKKDAQIEINEKEVNLLQEKLQK
jgi:peptidyl-prolyl cis-trans isomerase C